MHESEISGEVVSLNAGICDFLVEVGRTLLVGDVHREFLHFFEFDHNSFVVGVLHLFINWKVTVVHSVGIKTCAEVTLGEG